MGCRTRQFGISCLVITSFMVSRWIRDCSHFDPSRFPAIVVSKRRHQGSVGEKSAMESNTSQKAHHIYNQSEFDESNFDMVFWSETPMISEKATSSDFFVVHSYTRNESQSLNGFQEVFRIDLRVCNENCPPFKFFNQSELSTIKEYQRINGKDFEILSPMVGKYHDLFRPDKLTAVSFWSQKHQQHVKFTYPSNLDPKYCHPSLSCPERCPRQTPEHPYMFDSRDRLCKSTHPHAMPPSRAFGGRCDCATTCFTPEAVAETTIWPWKDEAQRDFFVPYWNDTARRNQLIREREKNRVIRRRPPYSRYQARFNCTTNATIPQGIAGDFGPQLFFIPEAKLIFCGIPKAGISEWERFLRFSFGARDYMTMPHQKLDREAFFVGNLESSRAQELFDDPTWTKAVFFRNPLERLVSAYQDKILRKGYTQSIFKIDQWKTTNQTVLSFPQFVDKVTYTNDWIPGKCSPAEGLSACTDVHWKPQLMMCGLDYLLPKFDFVGNFDHIAEQTKVLLEKVGIWDTLGQSYVGKITDTDETGGFCYAPPPMPQSNETMPGFNQRGPSAQYHMTDSRKKMDEFYTPALIARVRRAYALDFSVWDEISKKSVNEVSNGKDLEVVQEYCSRSKS